MELNTLLWASIFSAFFAQFLKMFTVLLREKRFSFTPLFQSGGMPSSHSAFVVCLSTSIGLVDGWASSTFAIATTFALIVMYDATGVRRAAGLQARVLNKMLEELDQLRTIQDKRLKELLGHTPREVLAGAILGLVIAFCFHQPWPGL